MAGPDTARPLNPSTPKCAPTTGASSTFPPKIIKMITKDQNPRFQEFCRVGSTRQNFQSIQHIFFRSKFTKLILLGIVADKITRRFFFFSFSKGSSNEPLNSNFEGSEYDCSYPGSKKIVLHRGIMWCSPGRGKLDKNFFFFFFFF
jgi:hypothetical protein